MHTGFGKNLGEIRVPFCDGRVGQNWLWTFTGLGLGFGLGLADVFGGMTSQFRQSAAAKRDRGD